MILNLLLRLGALEFSTFTIHDILDVLHSMAKDLSCLRQVWYHKIVSLLLRRLVVFWLFLLIFLFLPS